MDSEEFVELFMDLLKEEMTTFGREPSEEALRLEAKKVLKDLIGYVRSHEFQFGY